MNWHKLSSIQEIPDLLAQDKNRSVLIFKHSTRCPVSFAALKRIEKKWNSENEAQMQPFLVDVLKERTHSNEIGLEYNVEHASPQILLINREGCAYHAEHESITHENLQIAAR